MATTKASTASQFTAADLKRVQTTINSDDKVRSEFFRNPGAVLKREGITLPSDKTAQLTDFLKQAGANNREATVAGMRRVGTAASVEVSVTVTVKF